MIILIIISIIIWILFIGKRTRVISVLLLSIIIAAFLLRTISRFTIPVFNPGKKIAVVGSGPSGILTVKQLEKKGYNNITLYGLFDESQVETFNIDGVVVDTQACFFHAGYNNSIIKLCKEYDLNISQIYSSSLNPDIKQEHVNITLIFMMRIIWYYYIHRDPKILSMRASDLTKKWPSEPTYINGQLYGYTKDITVDNAISWYTSLFPTFSNITSTINYNSTYILDKGYAQLFKSILQDINARRDERLVAKIDEDGMLTHADGTCEKYDACVIACPYTNLETPLSLILGPDDQQKTRIFILLYLSDYHREKIGVYYNYEALNAGFVQYCHCNAVLR